MNPAPEVVAEFDAITWHFLPENEEAEKVREVPVRERCAALAAAAREAHRSEDGLLRCAACGWHKPEGPIVGDIVQLHHLDPVANAPKEGRRVNLVDAKKILVPLCPNCHSISHSRTERTTYGLKELKALF